MMEPLFISDTKFTNWHYTQKEDEWLCSQGVDAHITYRYELYVIDMPCIKVYQFVPDSDGFYQVDDNYNPVIATSFHPISSFPPGYKHEPT